jgi:hypothetical protein
MQTSERGSWGVAGNELQRAVGVAIAIYGFFMAIFPQQYTIPFAGLISAQALNPSANQGLGLIFMIVGAYLFMRKGHRREL